jgi:signal transduction histidine kinase
LVFLLLACPGFGEPLRTVAEIRALAVHEAQEARSVELVGTIIFVDPGTAYFQDETSGTFLRVEQPHSLRPGDRVEINGRTRMGLYVPGVTVERIVSIARTGLPRPQATGFDDLLSGRLHYQRAEVEGIVRTVSPLDEGRTLIRIAAGTRLIELRVEAAGEKDPRWIGAQVRATGLVAGVINDRRQLLHPYLRVADWGDLEWLALGAPAESIPLVPAGAIMLSANSGRLGQRVRVHGAISAVFSDSLYLVDGQSALRVQTDPAVTFPLGTLVEVIGFPSLGRASAMLVDARATRRAAGDPPRPEPVNHLSEIRSAHDAMLIAVTGTVADVTARNGLVSIALRERGGSVRVEIPVATNAIEVGSTLRIVGICQIESASGTPTYNTEVGAVTLRARDAADATVLKAPSWWTLRRLTFALIVLSAGTLGCLLWMTSLRRQVRRQTTALAQQLTSEAALEERHRIAREFHDSLEQELAGMRLRLDALATREMDPKATDMVRATTSLLARIQVETHNLIGDLRDGHGDGGDLAAALATVVANQTNVSGGTVLSSDLRRVPSLNESAVHHLRMIAREGINNALKHAGASRIHLTLDTRADALVMTVEDNGRGFDLTLTQRAAPGHFGCMGIRERADRIGATVDWVLVAGGGTRLVVQLELALAVRGYSTEQIAALALGRS